VSFSFIPKTIGSEPIFYEIIERTMYEAAVTNSASLDSRNTSYSLFDVIPFLAIVPALISLILFG